MTSNPVLVVARTKEVVFAGDGVLLAGQTDYPAASTPASGYPLVFVIHHAAGSTRADYDEVAAIALDAGYAVFRWDRRGTGRSGGGGRGSATQDTVNAYEIALEQPNIQRAQVVILAMGTGTGLLGTSYGLFARIQEPAAVLAVASQLDERQILALNTRILLVSGANDFNAPARFAAGAARAHRRAYPHGAEAFIAPGADRFLRTADGQLHPGVIKEISAWLQSLLRPSRSI